MAAESRRTQNQPPVALSLIRYCPQSFRIINRKYSECRVIWTKDEPSFTFDDATGQPQGVKQPGAPNSKCPATTASQPTAARNRLLESLFLCPFRLLCDLPASSVAPALTSPVLLSLSYPSLRLSSLS